MANFYIADTHFGHANIIRLDGRPFEDVEEMDSTLISNWNSAVSKQDTTYILGDFCWGKEPEWVRILPQLNGSKVLIRGNHDLKNPSERLRRMFQDVKDYKEITDGSRRVIMCHYPMLFYRSDYNPDVYMLCGHVHTTRENDFLDKWCRELRMSRGEESHSRANVYNVGAMMPWMNYTPRTLDEIIFGESAHSAEELLFS